MVYIFVWIIIPQFACVAVIFGDSLVAISTILRCRLHMLAEHTHHSFCQVAHNLMVRSFVVTEPKIKMDDVPAWVPFPATMRLHLAWSLIVLTTKDYIFVVLKLWFCLIHESSAFFLSPSNIHWMFAEHQPIDFQKNFAYFSEENSIYCSLETNIRHVYTWIDFAFSVAVMFDDCITMILFLICCCWAAVSFTEAERGFAWLSELSWVISELMIVASEVSRVMARVIEDDDDDWGARDI